MTAAFPAPMPGRKEDKGAEIMLPSEALKNSFLGIFIFLMGDIVCLGIFILSFRLTIKAEDPNRPVSRGKSGSFTGRFNAANPRNPASKKTMAEEIIFPSLRIK